MSDPFGLYIHWPFCRSKCPYCDFNSHVANTVDHDRWRKAYLAELDRLAPALKGRSLASIFFGGGTPSLMAPETVAAIIEHATQLWPAQTDDGPSEITLESNPTSIESAKFAAFARAGINRVSVGIQALDDDALKFLGREHSASEALAALDVACSHFDRVNADMIYARPGQTVAEWRRELDQLLSRALDHVSLYQLTIERGTPFFGLHAKGAFDLPDEDTATELFEVTNYTLAAQGIEAYEISNYARPGQECRHNLIYWRYFDYAGIGPGAHGRLTLGDGTACATVAPRRPDDWLAMAEGTGTRRIEVATLSPRTRLEELVMMGLRLSEGIGDDDLARIQAGDIDTAFNPVRLARLINGGFLAHDHGRLRALPEGRLRLDAVLAELLA